MNMQKEGFKGGGGGGGSERSQQQQAINVGIPVAPQPASSVMMSMLSWKTVEFGVKVALFLIYFSVSMVIGAANWGNKGCFVQSTYRQEFASNMVANPLFSSTNMFRDAPKSQLETVYYNASRYEQMASDVLVFPNIIYDPTPNAAFLPVAAAPGSLLAAGEVIPTTKRYGWVYYYDPATGDVSVSNPDMQAPLAYALKRAMLSSVHGGSRPGMQLPNLGRCLKRYLPSISGTPLTDVPKLVADMAGGKTEWNNQLNRLKTNSHMRGTCLLTGQQATVDVTSNPKTSVILFSSVNILFMLLVIVWITASFALFDIGGWLKETNDELEAINLSNAYEPDGNMSCCEWWSCWNWWTTDDLFVLIGIVWNAALIVAILVPEFRMHNSIPLNNAIVGVFALLVAILVQWTWANFRYSDMQDAAADTALAIAGDAPIVPSEVPRGIPVIQEPPEKAVASTRQSFHSQQTSSSSYSHCYYYPADLDTTARESTGTAAASPAMMFDTSNFLSTASAVRMYGAQCANSFVERASGAFQGAGMMTLRRRPGASSYSSEEYGSSVKKTGFNMFASAKEKRVQRLRQMPAYTAMVQFGSPIARYNYRNILKKESMDDSIQSMDYTITTPLLFASILPVISPTVATGMVQLMMGAFLGSHLLCIPILYMSHMSVTYRSMYPQHFHWKTNGIAIVCFLGACATLQGIGLGIFLSYYIESSVFYGTDANFQAAILMLVVMQCLFVVTVVSVSIAGMVASHEWFDAMARYASMLYKLFNLLIKMVVPLVILSAAGAKKFPVLSCNAWEGSFQNSA